MARSARKQLADMRAMEEENMRMELHGSGKHFYGAGATPSMGLSQFRGGAKKGKKVKYEDEEYESEEEMEGGQAGAVSRLVSRFLPRVAPRTSTAIVPYVPRVAPRTSTALIPLGPLGRPMARPALSARQYGRMFQARPAASPFARGARAAVTRAAKRFGPTAARAAALGATLGAVGSYLGDQFGADSGDAGYFDDYAGEEYEDYIPPTGETGEFAPEDLPLIPAEGELPEGLTPDELAWYLQSGNLPARYAMAPSLRKRRGKGKLEITHHEGGLSMRSSFLDRIMGKPPKRGQHLESAMYERAQEEAKKRSAKERAALAKKALEAAMKKKGGRVSKLEKATSRVITQPFVKNTRTGISETGKRHFEKVKSGRSARAQVVREVMKERGCSLPEASRIVKEEGLY